MAEGIDIYRADTKEGGRYSYNNGGDEAEMTFTKLGPSLISIDHTFVPDSMRGQGIAQALALNAIIDARLMGWKIIPRCSFMHAQLKRHTDWSDVVAVEAQPL